MRTLFYILIVIALLVVMFVVSTSVINSKTNDIKEHFAKENKEVRTIEHQFTTFGSPFFYVNKGQYIFKVELTNDELWWVRTGVFSDDYEKEK